MANVRLKVAMIIDGKLYPRSSVVQESLLPEHFRTELLPAKWRIESASEIGFRYVSDYKAIISSKGSVWPQ